LSQRGDTKNTPLGGLLLGMKGNDMMASWLTTPYALDREEGYRLQSWGALVVVKASWAHTGGVFNLFEVTCPPGYATPLHIHYAEDVAVYVLEGALTIFWGNEPHEAAAGSYWFQPRGIPHGFRVAGATPARILYMSFPGGFDRLVIEQELRAAHCGCVTAAARYQIEIVGPLPE
jgi:quercetin dioxygenase-like cupin family protein